ncbi:arrestin domain-containing protein 17-like [Trichogramma pretiosum]|uniref:arrestin domain-containing protein 17-like n=1 Tax=Trichogramma pretiosum TaxID=7493 RepID=UPI0006C94302|nr:arrestin domain-containing protein 17-like [Trichogramma pretiosum]
MSETEARPSLDVARQYGVKKIEIHLDNSKGVYMRRVSGRVDIQLSSPVNAKGIRVTCKGEAKVQFSDRSMGIRTQYSKDEQFVNLTPYIYGTGHDQIEVTSGHYDFSLELPDRIPCSFEGLYGRVRYTLQATLQLLDNGCAVCSDVKPFTLASVYDLNSEPKAAEPIEEDHSKTFVGQKEPLKMSLHLPVRGFVPGQTVPLLINFKNESNVRMSKIRIVMKKVVTYRAHERSRTHKEIIVEIELPVSDREEQIKEFFDIPAIPPSRMEYCSIIDLRYSLKVESCVDLTEWYYRMLQKNLKIRAEIFVGTVPLKDYEQAIPYEDESPMGSRKPSSADLRGQNFEASHIYKSSKPGRDDPAASNALPDDFNCAPYNPMYRVYRFEKSSDR